jgi:hypothetical protein
MSPGGVITIRPLGAGDDAAVGRLAQLDSAAAPDGELLGIEVEGRLLAVTSLSTGVTVADPLSRTQELVALLELRRHQLRSRVTARRATRPAPVATRRPAARSGSLA